MESAEPLWPVMENHEALELRRLSTSECDSTKGQQGPLGSLPYGNGEREGEVGSKGSVGWERDGEVRCEGGGCEHILKWNRGTG